MKWIRTRHRDARSQWRC